MTDLPPIICPSCNATYRHPGRAGKTKCSKCGSAIVVVLPESAATAAPRRSPGSEAPQPPRPRAPQPKPARPGVVVPHHRPHSRHGRPHTQVIPEGEHPLPRKQPGMSQGMMIACAAGLGVAVIAVIIWLASGGGNAVPGPAPKKTAEKSDAPKRRSDALDELLGSGEASDPTPIDEPDITEPEVTTPKEETPKPKPPPKPKASKYETRYDDLKPFDPVPGTTPEEVKEIQRLLELAADFNSGAEGYRAQDKVISIGKKAIPITLNKYLEVNLDGNIDSIRRGKTFNEVLKDITGEIHSYAVTEDQEGGYYRSVARLQWHRWWEKNKDTWTGPADDEEEDF